MSAYTPGPWTVHPYRARVCPLIELDEPVAELLWPTKVRSEAETFANARLIAAAPDLLALLERIRDDRSWRTNDNALWTDLLAAIDKATRP